MRQDPVVPRPVVIVGAGPAGLMAAEVLASAGEDLAITIHDRMPSAGRKFQLAGRGGLNLTHTEPLERLLDRYGDARPALEPAIRAFDPAAVRAWTGGLGQRAVVGTSGRVFPEAFRATPLLRAWLRRLDDAGVTLRTGSRWLGWDEAGRLRFGEGGGDGVVEVEASATVLALGGASWPRTGSDGSWVDVVRGAGIDVTALRPANGGFVVDWSPVFRSRFAGSVLKTVSLSVGDATARGDLVLTAAGIEGGPVYALGRHLRDDTDAVLRIDLRPDVDAGELAMRLQHRRRPKDSLSSTLRRTAGLSPAAIALLRESGALPASAQGLARRIKDVRLRLAGPQPIDRAISTAGGIALGEIDERFMLRRRPGTFVAGEMLDWEAPTGGYLLQATLSTAVAAARGALDWLASS
jgi:uncharacterized flavoprotein (TIGR03862 family)